jgi:hypothetical protein
MDEVVEHLCEVVAACFFHVYGGREFGDGGQRALFLVELDCVDEVVGSWIGRRFVRARVRAGAGKIATGHL